MIDLIPTWTLLGPSGELWLTEYPYGVDRSDSVDVGEPAAVVESVSSMLVDGDAVTHLRDGNRVYTLVVWVEGPSLGDVARAEADLRNAVRSAQLLRHDPGDMLSPASDYEVLAATIRAERMDAAESHLMRRFVVTLTCSPFARSVGETRLDAWVITPPPAPTLIEEPSSTAGWAASRGGTPVTPLYSAGTGVWLGEFDNNMTAPEQWALGKNFGPIDFSTEHYLIVEATFTGSGSGRLDIRAFGSPAGTGWSPSSSGFPLVAARVAADDPGVLVMAFETYGYEPWIVADPIARLQFTHTSRAGDLWQILGVRKISKASRPPMLSNLQSAALFGDIGGSERTPVKVTVNTANPLGTAIIHTAPPSSAQPPLRRWRTAGGTVTTDLANLSGETETIAASGSWVAEVPVQNLPEGTYSLAMRADISTAGAINYTVGTIPEGESTPKATVSGSFKRLSIGMHVCPIAVLALPTLRASEGHVRVTITSPSGGPSITIDEVWLFREGEDCGLTIVDTGEDELTINPPTPERPVPSVMVGAAHPGTGLIAQGVHVARPEGVSVFAATLAQDPEVNISYHKRWHTNAAE